MREKNDEYGMTNGSSDKALIRSHERALNPNIEAICNINTQYVLCDVSTEYTCCNFQTEYWEPTD